MRISNTISKLFFLSIFLSFGACEPEPESDPCLTTKWAQSREYEIQLAVHLSTSNPNLPGGTSGSLKPEDFKTMIVSGTIEKVECSDSTSGPVYIGNTYIPRGIDNTAPVEVVKSYWIGHVVYVYEFNNDLDRILLNITVKVTMTDGQSYLCTYNKIVNSEEIEQVPYEMYYYILLDVYTDNWIKV